MSEDYMHIIYNQKQDRFWSGWFRILTAQPVNCAKWFLSFGPVGDSSAEWLVWNLTASILLL